MIEICDSKNCTGCAACLNACKHDALSVQLNEEGFLKYKIIPEKCINCYACKKVCPVNGYYDDGNFKKPIAYLTWNLDEEVRIESSSGGLFSSLAKVIFDEEGYVFGAAFDEKFRLNHISVNSYNELGILRGSKYIQSNIGKTFISVKEKLQQGSKVLFSGVPCQIAGLYKYLGKKYDNLITCDLICHGVGSTAIFNDTLDYLQKKNKSKILNINYRDKNTGWKTSSVTIKYDSGKEESEIRNTSLLAYSFASGMNKNEVCSSCIHCTLPRRADITLGDYGGNDDVQYGKENQKSGMSIVLINSQNGEEIFGKIKHQIFYEEKDLQEILKSQTNIATSNDLHPLRKVFFERYRAKGFPYLLKKYLIAPIKLRLIYKLGYERYVRFVKCVRKLKKGR